MTTIFDYSIKHDIPVVESNVTFRIEACSNGFWLSESVIVNGYIANNEYCFLSDNKVDAFNKCITKIETKGECCAFDIEYVIDAVETLRHLIDVENDG